jgi:signal transduction histidine kinase
VDGTEVDLPTVLADPIQIQVLLVNLLRNAIESMDSIAVAAGQPITISADQTAEGEVEVRIADQGPGIAFEVGEEIFEPLFSTKANGMGVGLATCRTIVEAHGGKIWFSPNGPRGVVFHFTLPVASAT